MDNEKIAAQAAGTAIGGMEEKTDVQGFTPRSDSITHGSQKQLEREERLLSVVIRTAIENGGAAFIPFSTLSTILLIPEDELKNLCNFREMFGGIEDEPDE